MRTRADDPGQAQRQRGKLSRELGEPLLGDEFRCTISIGISYRRGFVDDVLLDPAVVGERREEDEAAGAPAPGRFDQRKTCIDIVANQRYNIDARDRRCRRNVHDSVERPGKLACVCQISPDQLKPRDGAQACQQIRVAAIGADDVVAAAREPARHCAAREAGDAGHEHAHRPPSADRGQDPFGRQAVRREQIVGRAVIVDEGVLQREGIQPAGGADVPRDLLHLRGEPALRRVLLDHDDLAVPLQGAVMPSRSSGFSVCAETSETDVPCAASLSAISTAIFVITP